MITAVENAATNIPPGLPNAAIAQGALFVVKGKNLGPANVVVASTFPLLISMAEPRFRNRRRNHSGRHHVLLAG